MIGDFTGQSNLRDALIQLLPSVNRQAEGTTVAALTDSINLRGLSPNQTLVLVDGKRRHATTNIFTDAGPFRGATPVDISLVPASSVERIEALRDGASAQYGSDAVAGVVNIILKKDAGNGYASVQSGLYGEGDGFTQNADAEQGWALGQKGYVRAGISYQHRARTDRTGIDTRTGQYTSHWIGDPASDRVSLSLKGAYQLANSIEAYGLATYAHRTGNTFQIYRLPSILPQVYPNGFSPRLGSIENDYAVTADLRGNDLAGFNWDVSSTYGSDNISYNMWDSANTTLYARTGSTPTAFHLKDLRNAQWTNDIDLKRALDLPLLGKTKIALGGEHRHETFHEGAGDDASTIYGGSQAVPGVLGTLFRIRQHMVGQIASRYDISPLLALRGTYATGPRAPTLAEEHHTAATVTTSGATGQLPPGSPGAILLGATPLNPERSRSISAGVTSRPAKTLNIQIDAYQILLRDRILDGGSYSGTSAVAAFLANRRTLPDGYTLSAVSASYLTNASNTRTRGLDVNATWRVDLGENSKIVFNLAANFNDTQIQSIKTNALGRSVLNAQQIAFLTAAQPRNSQVIGFTWSNPRASVALHARRYGSIFDQMTYQQGASAFSTSVFQPFRAAPIAMVNLAVDYKLTQRINVAVGGNNILNSYSTKVPELAQFFGQALYDRCAQQTTFNGGFYYIRLGVKL